MVTEKEAVEKSVAMAKKMGGLWEAGVPQMDDATNSFIPSIICTGALEVTAEESGEYVASVVIDETNEIAVKGKTPRGAFNALKSEVKKRAASLKKMIKAMESL